MHYTQSYYSIIKKNCHESKIELIYFDIRNKLISDPRWIRSATKSTIGSRITRDLRSREREIWRQSLIENPVVLAIPPGSIVRDANYVVSSDAAYLWRGIKTGGPTGGGTGHPLQPDVGMSPSRAFTRNFYFPCEKKKNETAEDGSGRKTGEGDAKTRWVSGERGGKERGREETTR